LVITNNEVLNRLRNEENIERCLVIGTYSRMGGSTLHPKIFFDKDCFTNWEQMIVDLVLGIEYGIDFFINKIIRRNERHTCLPAQNYNFVFEMVIIESKMNKI